jgi:hypothetical protein
VIFNFLETSTFCSRRRFVKMNLQGSREALPPEAVSVGPWVTFLEIFRHAGTLNLINALAAILFWSLLIGAVAVCYELWRLNHDWRLGMA